MKYFLIKKDSNAVKSFSDEIPEYDQDLFLLVESSDDDVDGYSWSYDGTLHKEKVLTPEEQKQQTIDTISKATSMNDLKDILINLLS